MLGVISCHLLLGRAASNPQAHTSCEQAGSNNKKPTGGRSPDRSCHLHQTLNAIPIIGHVPASKDETCCGPVAGFSPWLQPWPGTFRRDICRRGFCQRDTCRRDTCQLGRSEQPVEDEACPQQPLIPQVPTMRRPRSRISTSKPPAVSGGLASLMLVTGSITRIQNRPFGALFFTKCCRKGTNPGDCDDLRSVCRNRWFRRCAGRCGRSD